MVYGKRINGELVVVDERTRVTVNLRKMAEFESYSKRVVAVRRKEAIKMELKNGVYQAV